MSAARSLDAAMKRIDEIRERQRRTIEAQEWPEWAMKFTPEVAAVLEIPFPCDCEPDESCQECDAA